MSFRVFCFAVVTMVFGSGAAIAQSLVPNGECALVVAARPNLSETRAYVNTIQDRRFLKVYRAQNGWYAISIGTLRPSEVDSVMAKWKASGKIPRDAYCSKGKKYVEIVAGFGSGSGATTGAQRAPAGSPVLEVMNNAPIDLMRMCTNVILFGFQCFDLHKVVANSQSIYLEPYVGNVPLKLSFKKDSSSRNTYWGRMNGKPCKLTVYDTPRKKDENDSFIWAALAYRACEDSYVVVMIPKNASARAEALKSRLRSETWLALMRSL